MIPRKAHQVVLSLAVVLLAIAGCATTQPYEFKTVTVEEIIQMSKDKVPTDQIIKKIAESGTVYRLSASQLADLRDAGVPNEVVNYMQQTYLDAVRRDQARRDMRYWSAGPNGYWYGGVPYGWW